MNNNGDEEADVGFVEMINDATRAAEGQHAHELEFLREFERILVRNDTQLRDELSRMMRQRRQRRALIARNVASAAFEVVGQEPPPHLLEADPPPKVIREAQPAPTPPPLPSRKPLSDYDRSVDPLNIYGRGQK